MREVISKYIVLLTSALIVLLSIIFALSQNQDEDKIKKETPSPLALKRVTLDSIKIHKGKKLFSSQGCVLCHSIEGKGNRRNSLDGVGERLEEEALESWIIASDSLKGKMPERAFEQKQRYKQLVPHELEALVEYMQSLRSDSNETVAMQKSTDINGKTTKEQNIRGENGSCLECHINAGHMMQMVKPKDALSDDGCAVAPSRPAFLNAFVNKDFKHSTHGKLGCTDCHGGNAKEADQRKAHLGMVSAESKCVNCHSEISKLHATSLHGTLIGMHCLDCHKNDMHGDGTVYTSRWNVKGRPQCTDCHDGLEKSQIPYRR